MKEIIYIQAGNISNHVGTHFWNAQQSYFTYGGDKEVLVDHDVSFREGTSPRGEPTYCPRVLQIDRKANFGSLSSAKGLYAEDDKDDVPSSSLWLPGMAPWTRYTKTLYWISLTRSNWTRKQTKTLPTVPPLRASEVRYWSDYNRVYYLPRSIHKLPDLADWEITGGDWQGGKETFLRYDSENALMDDSFRLFVEECDAFQGLQLCTDNASFGSFANSFLTAFRDEFPKHPTLMFSVLSDAVPGDLDVDDMRGIRKALNDALCMHGLNELSSMTVPLQSPSNWRPGPWTAELTTDLRGLYEASGLLSAHVETATLPLRLKGHEPLYGLCHRSNVYGNTPFAELSGAFPASSRGAPACRRDVTRGWPELDRRQFDDSSASTALKCVTARCTHRRSDHSASPRAPHSFHAPMAYPLPCSFPSFFAAQDLNVELRHTRHGILTRQRSVPMVSTLASGRALPQLLTQYADFVGQCVRRKIDWATVDIIDKDEARQLRDELWTLRDNFGEWSEVASDRNNGGLGEDEDV
ncbi:tubulin domain-containing protein [Russula brevipes]|nr:tubulin domain-containing protein [Russula brevipes]